MNSMKIVESQKLNELAYTRSIAVDKCASLGEQFVDHFKKIYKEHDYNGHDHHTKEMQAWYDKVKKIKLTYTNDYITVNRVNDWFFTVGSDYYTMMDKNEDMSSCYADFCNLLMDNYNKDYTIKDALKEVGLYE